MTVATLKKKGMNKSPKMKNNQLNGSTTNPSESSGKKVALKKGPSDVQNIKTDKRQTGVTIVKNIKAAEKKAKGKNAVKIVPNVSTVQNKNAGKKVTSVPVQNKEAELLDTGNKKNKGNKRKLAAKDVEEQVHTKVSKVAPSRQQKALGVAAQKQKLDAFKQTFPESKVESRHLTVVFPKAFTNFKLAMLKVLDLCENVSCPHQLNVSFKNSQKIEKSISLLNNITVDGRNIHVHRENDPLRRIVKIRTPHQDLEDIKQNFGAESIKPLSLRKNCLYYLLSFKTNKDAVAADAKTVTIANSNLKVAKYSIYVQERETMYGSDYKTKHNKLKVHEVAINFPVGSLDHKAALLQILKLSDVLESPFRLYLSYKSIEEAAKKVPLIESIVVDDMKLRVKSRKCDPLRRVITIEEVQSTEKENIMKNFNAMSIEPLASKGKTAISYTLIFKNKEAAKKADAATLTINGKEFRVRDYIIFADRMETDTGKPKREKRVKKAAEATKRVSNKVESHEKKENSGEEEEEINEDEDDKMEDDEEEESDDEDEKMDDDEEDSDGDEDSSDDE